jgi:hypothetical protein
MDQPERGFNAFLYRQLVAMKAGRLDGDHDQGRLYIRTFSLAMFSRHLPNPHPCPILGVAQGCARSP